VWPNSQKPLLWIKSHFVKLFKSNLDVQQTVQIVNGNGHSAMSDPVTIYIYVTVVVHNLFGKVFFQRSFLSNILKFLKKRKKNVDHSERENDWRFKQHVDMEKRSKQGTDFDKRKFCAIFFFLGIGCVLQCTTEEKVNSSMYHSFLCLLDLRVFISSFWVWSFFFFGVLKWL